MQVIRSYGGSRHVVTTLNDDTRNVGQPTGIADQLTFPEPTAMEEVEILDACEGQRVARITEVSNQALIRLKGDSCSLPRAPGNAGRPMYGGIGVEQQGVIGGNGVASERATAQRGEEHLVAFRKQLAGGPVVVEVELPAPKCENSSQHKLCDPVTVFLGVRQGKRAAPGATEDLPPLDTTMLTKPLHVCNQVPGGIGPHIGARFAGVRPASATTALIKEDDAIAPGVEKPAHLWIQPSTGPTVQEACGFA